MQAYSLNVTVVPKGSLRWLTVSPSNSSIDPNNVSTLNAYDGRTKANAVIVPADTSNNDRAINVFAKDATDVVLDINGYYVPQSSANLVGVLPGAAVPGSRYKRRGPRKRSRRSLHGSK